MNRIKKETRHYFREILGALSPDEIVTNSQLIMRATQVESLLRTSFIGGHK
jgi:hypothetical protein